MRPVPPVLTVISITYAAMSCVMIYFRGWRPESWRYWPRNYFAGGVGRFPHFVVAGLFLILFWSWILFSTPAPATGDPRSRGGYSPAEQKELIK